MKTICAVLGLSLMVCARGFAIPITLFSDTDTYVKRAKDIVIVRCVKVPDRQEGFVDGFFPADVEVLMTLKGEKNAGPLKIGTVYTMEPDRKYLLASLGGSAFGTDFLALPELSVVPIPDGFDFDQLTGKSTKQQVQIIFSRHLYEIERQLAPLLEQQRMLQTAVEDKTDDLFESKGNVKLGEIRELVTTKKNSSIFLQLEAGPLGWSNAAPGESGYFYFTDRQPETPDWEFAATDAKEIAEFEGHPLKARFYQAFSPARDKRFGSSGFGNAIDVSVGQIVLARTSKEPRTIYILKIQQQSQQEAMTVRYAVIGE